MTLPRRDFLHHAAGGLAGIALAQLLSRDLEGKDRPRAEFNGGLHHRARARRVLQLFMNGGVSQVDTFDPKPALTKYNGQPLPGGSIKTERKTGALMQSPFSFQKYGQSGIEMSEIWPHLSECADEPC